MRLPALKPRRPWRDDEPDGYMESDFDYLDNNRELAVALLDAQARNTKPTTIAQLQAMQRKVDEVLNAEIERRMRAIFAKHKSLGCLLKCMGAIIAYGKDGEPFDLCEPPRFLKSLLDLAELDLGYYSLTGHPLKLTRGPNGETIETRDW